MSALADRIRIYGWCWDALEAADLDGFIFHEEGRDLAQCHVA